MGRTRALSTRIWQAGDGGAESSIPTRKATPAREKTLGRHSSAASRPDPESGDALLWETSVLDPVGEEHPHRAGRRGPAPGAAAGNHSLTMGDKPRVGSRHERAPPELAGRQEVPLPDWPSGLKPGGGGQQSMSRPTTGRQAKCRLGASVSELAGGKGVPLQDRPSGPTPGAAAGTGPAVKVQADQGPTS